VTVHGDRPQGHDAHVVVKTQGGKFAETTLDVGIPERDLGRQGDRLARKFRSLAVPLIGDARAERLQRNIAALETLPDIRPIMAV
jgi:hypothetical protein